jgi:hypothetical protein
MEGGYGDIDPYIEKPVQVVEVLGKAGAKDGKSTVRTMREEAVSAETYIR